jgi:hypothetical protein
MAIKQPELVDINFLAQYLEKCTMLRQGSYKTNLEQEMIDMIKTKLSDPTVINEINPKSSVDLIKSSVFFQKTIPEMRQIALNMFERDNVHHPQTVLNIYNI